MVRKKFENTNMGTTKANVMTKPNMRLKREMGNGALLVPKRVNISSRIPGTKRSLKEVALFVENSGNLLFDACPKRAKTKRQ